MAELIQSELDISGRLGRKRQGLGLALSAILSAGDRHRGARKDFSKTDLAGPTCVCLSICVTRAVGHKIRLPLLLLPAAVSSAVSLRPALVGRA